MRAELDVEITHCPQYSPIHRMEPLAVEGPFVQSWLLVPCRDLVFGRGSQIPPLCRPTSPCRTGVLDLSICSRQYSRCGCSRSSSAGRVMLACSSDQSRYRHLQPCSQISVLVNTTMARCRSKSSLVTWRAGVKEASSLELHSTRLLRS